MDYNFVTICGVGFEMRTNAGKKSYLVTIDIMPAVHPMRCWLVGHEKSTGIHDFEALIDLFPLVILLWISL